MDDNENDNMDFTNISDGDLDCKISEQEVRRAVFKQNNGKASGPDEIPTEIIKASYEQIAPYLVSIYNYLFENADYPESWDLGYIIPLFKGGDPKQAKFYRGITLNSILAKIYSQILINRLTTWKENHEKSQNFNSDIKKEKNTTKCIFILHSMISKVLHEGQNYIQFSFTMIKLIDYFCGRNY